MRRALSGSQRFDALREAFQDWANALYSHAGPDETISSHTVAKHIEFILEREADANAMPDLPPLPERMAKWFEEVMETRCLARYHPTYPCLQEPGHKGPHRDRLGRKFYGTREFTSTKGAT